MTKILDLPNVTLVCIDCVDYIRAQTVLEHSSKFISFKEIKLLTSLKNDIPYSVNIKHINNSREYSRFIIFDLHRYIKTPYVMIIQHDGYVLNPYAWRYEYLHYDYIGAPWHFIGDANKKVGNGGFSIRSRKFLELSSKIMQGKKCHPEDEQLCRTYNRDFVSQGIKFAPEALAKNFSIEDGLWNKQMGFHNYGITNLKNHVDREDIPFFNILTRTSGRKNLFARCRNSVANQTYNRDNVRHIISVDDSESLNYVTKYTGIEYLEVTKNKKPGNFPQNLYMNHLFDCVEKGWIFILDDDDTLASSNVLMNIADVAEDENNLLMFRMRWKSGRVIPNNKNFLKNPAQGDIGSPCVCFHSNYLFNHRDLFKWDAYKEADYRFISKLYTAIPNKIRIHNVVVQLSNDGGLGKREDI